VIALGAPRPRRTLGGPEWDVAIVGGGILGTSLALWLAQRYDARIAVLEREADVAEHTSKRNTGIVHRPFYLDPVSRRVFARASQVSYGLWKRYAAERRLPWLSVGTFEVASEEKEVAVLEKYLKWGHENGMNEDELEVLDDRKVRYLEPNVRCAGAIHSKTDTAVDYHAFTQALRRDAEALGAKFLFRSTVTAIHSDGGVAVELAGSARRLRARFLVNCAGGSSLRVAHLMGLGLEYADLHFRGEYWRVDPRFSGLATRNVYSVPRHREFPFLDPHWIVRTDGHVDIGPNAVPVPGPTQYTGLLGRPSAWLEKAFEPPLQNKLTLLGKRDFRSLVLRELLSSLSKAEMAERVRRFLPGLRSAYLESRGFAGVRSSVIDPAARFVPEAIELHGPTSFHITNYNSPGATGAPAYAANLVSRLESGGFLPSMRRRTLPAAPSMFDFDLVVAAVG